MDEDANQDAHLDPVEGPEEPKQDEPSTTKPEETPAGGQPDLIQQAKDMIFGKKKEDEEAKASQNDSSPVIDPSDPLDKRFLVPLPEKISMVRISQISEVKTVWNKGVRELEQIFNSHLQRMSDMFEDKTLEFETVRKQLNTNHDFLNRYYLDMQGKLNEKHNAIQKERDEWEADKEKIRAMVKMDSEVVALNVGGTHHMMTERDILRQVPGSTLEKFFNGMHELKKIDDKVFLDRDGKSFQYLVNYLRND